MIEQKIVNHNFEEKNIREENYSAFWIKSFGKGDHIFIECKEKNIFSLNRNLGASKGDKFISTSKDHSNLVVGFLKNEEYMKIVYYQGNGGVQKIFHDSKKDPVCMIIKKVNGKGDWLIWLEPLGYNNFLLLNSYQPYFENQYIFLSNPPNRHYFKISSDEFNESGSLYMAILLFRSEYFNVGLYKGNVDFVDTLVKNDLLLIKNVTNKGNWRLFSSKLNSGNSSFKLNTNSALSENDDQINVQIKNNFFYPKKNCNAINNERDTYVYLSFGEKEK